MINEEPLRENSFRCIRLINQMIQNCISWLSTWKEAENVSSPANLEWDSDTNSVLFCQTNEGGDSLFPVLPLGRHGADVGPVHDLCYLDHGQGLEVVGRNDPRKILETRFVWELGWRGSITDLRNLSKEVSLVTF